MAISSTTRGDVSRFGWRQFAACKVPGAALFFAPLQHERKAARASRESQAKAVCMTCQVRGVCLEDALERGETFGVWGGLTTAERTELSAQRAEAA